MNTPSRRKRQFSSRYSRHHQGLAIFVILCMTTMILSLPAMARNIYMITDGNDSVLHSTFSEDFDVVLAEAGVSLAPSDTYTANQTESGTEIIVARMQEITVAVDSQVLHAQTYGEPLREVLDSMNIQLGEQDLINHPLDMPTQSGLYVKITRVTEERITYSEVIPSEKTVFHNSVMYDGQETILEEGSDGEASVTSKITYNDGVEVSREITNYTVSTPSVDSVVIASAENPTMPVMGENNTLTTSGGAQLSYSKVIDGMGTAYTCEGYTGHTATGAVAKVGRVAVDPRVIPLGSKLYIVSQDGTYVYGYAIAEDTGGLVKGNRVDLYMDTYDACINFGYRPITVYVVE